jgi:AcrR family transcriptional regulator
MPKAPRSQEDREVVRTAILTEALALLSDQGFKHFSMRKLAARLGMSATTIYNYFSSKDELYLMILTRGFEDLVNKFRDINQKVPEPREKIRRLILAYVDFGITNAYYYNIMFTSDAPKYLDYVGTAIEPVAYHEKSTALKLMEITSSAIMDMTKDRDINELVIRNSILRLWSTLHGIISLYNSRVLHEVEEDPRSTVYSIVEDIIHTFQGIFLGSETARLIAVRK